MLTGDEKRMASSNGSARAAIATVTGSGGEPANPLSVASLRPAWSAFVRFCEELGHGEIDCLKIQDGVPVLAEVTKKKIKFG